MQVRILPPEYEPVPYLRALGWAALASAPVLLATLAVASARPDAPVSLVPRSLWVAWLIGAVAFVGALTHHRGGERIARGLAVFAGVLVVAWAGFLVWLAAATS